MSKRQPLRAASAQPRVAAGFKLFLVCVLLAGILGAAVKLYFAPARIERFIRSQIEKQNLPVKIEFKHARLTLARGLMPTFAIDVLGVKVSHFAPCVAEPFADIALLKLPVDWFKLLTGRIQLGFVIADGVSASVDRAQCSQMNALFKLPAAHDDLITVASITREPNELKPWFKVEDLERIKKVIAGFEIQNGTIFFDDSKKSVRIAYFDIWHKGSDVKLDGEVELPPQLTYGQVFPPLEFRGSVTPVLAKLHARSAFAEGEIAASIELSPTDNPASPDAKVLFQAGAMPLSIFSDFLRQLGVLSNSKLNPKFLWLNCEVTSEGPLLKLIKQTPLKVANCMVEGDAGRIDIGPALRTAEGEWQPFKVEIKNFDIEDLLKTFSEKGPSGVLSSFGVLNGTLEFLGKDRQSFSGSLEDIEVYFSNRNVRAYQKVTSINVEASRTDNDVSGKILNVYLAGGKMAGEINFAFDKRFESGTMNFDTRELSLDPKIETLMADGLFDDLSLKGLLTVREHKLASWTGQIQARSYSGSQLKIIKPVVDTRFANGRFDITAQSSAGELSPQSKWLGWIKGAAGDIAISSAGSQGGQEEQWIPISNIRTQISIEQGLIGWKNATLTAKQSSVQVTSTGEIKNNREVAGLLTTIEPGAAGNLKNRQFVISGAAQSPTLTPKE